MKFTSGNIYHIYNRGNNKQPVFIEKRNYEFFRAKIKKHIIKYSELICYCLLPNHFHLMVQIKNNTLGNELSNEIGIMLRSYTRAINLQEERTGSLFQQKTKAKYVNSHSVICFNYIHQNPIRAGIADKIDDWEYSSFNEYLGRSRNPICNTELGRSIIGFKTIEEFFKLSYQNIEPEKKDELF